MGLWDDNSETDSRPFFCQYGLIVLGPTTTTTTTSTSSNTTTTASKVTTNASIEDCPTIDLGWPHAWKVYGSKCYFLVGYPFNMWSSAKQHCDEVKYHGFMDG